MSRFRLSAEALADLREIWEYVARDSFDAADRVYDRFYAFGNLVRMPGMGHTRTDLTKRRLLFWPVGS